MATRRIIVGIDGSEGSRRALRWAIGEAERSDALIEAVTVWQSPFAFGGTFGVHVDERNIEEAARKRLAATIADTADDSSAVRIEQVVAEGDPAWVLCHRASGADLLVVGSVGHSPFAGAALGSVSTRCGQCSPCPVVIVPKVGQASPDAAHQ
ncbi:MAG: universal stress protein [Actinomycetota bacterium]|jgi:nucleotide-binding universal stress UspA family protein|nr:universal stress protein [Actinomycetota bacterium]MDA8314515.1 universal stress protein [Actinomycetota bacterium]